MRLSRVRADVQRTLGVLHIVVRIGHGTVAPGVRNTGHGRGVANTRLMVAVVRPEHAHKFAQHVRLLVIVLRRANPENAVRPGSFAKVQQFVADLCHRLFPADANVLTVHELHGVLQAMLTVTMLTNRSSFCAMRTKIDWRIKHWLLPCPNAVLDNCVNCAANRTVGAYRAFDFRLARALCRRGCIGFAYESERQLARKGTSAKPNARALEERTSVQRTAQRCTTSSTEAAHGGMIRQARAVHIVRFSNEHDLSPRN